MKSIKNYSFVLLGIAAAILVQWTDQAVWASTILFIYALLSIAVYVMGIVGMVTIFFASSAKGVDNIPYDKRVPVRRMIIGVIISMPVIAYPVYVLTTIGTVGGIVAGVWIITLLTFYWYWSRYILAVYRTRRKEANMVE